MTDDARPKAIYATAANTSAVRKGYEMSGWLKNREEIEAWDAKHKAQEDTVTTFWLADDHPTVVPVHEPQKTAHKPVSFHVPGPVTGKGRARIGKIGNHARMFTPAKTVAYEGLVAHCAHIAMEGRPPITGPLQCNILVGIAIPASWSKKKRAQALAGEVFPTGKPDWDNFAKAASDAMNGIIYADDAQIVTGILKKRYREAPGLWVTVFQIGGDHV